MFQTFISRHNSNFFSDKLVLTSVTPASSAPVLQTPKATSSTLYFDSLTVNAGNGGFLHCIQMDTSVNAANQVVSVDKLCLIFKLAPSVCRMTFPILASLLVRLVVLLPFQLLRLSLATPSRWTPLALSVFLHCVVALLLTLL